jgi:F0F1-type ATP synthase assembly protein I
MVLKKEEKMIPNRQVLAMALQIGFSTSFSAVAFIVSGHYLDKHFNTSPILTIIGLILGLVVSLYLVWQIVKALQIKK